MSRLFQIAQLLALIGIVLAIFLLWERYTTPAFQPCNINSTINCNAIISGEVSNTLGVPTPLIGLVGYVIIFFAATRKMKKLLLGMATCGLLFCMYIGYRELFQLHVICPVCILCQVDMLVVFILAFILYKNPTNLKTQKPNI